jgi:hypothetical protein
VFSADDVDANLRQLAGDPEFAHRSAAGRAVRFRATGDVADLVAVLDDPDHPCGMNEVLFAMAGTGRLWLNWLPMPTEAITSLADEVGGRRARGEDLTLDRAGLSAAEVPSAIAAARRAVGGTLEVGIGEFPRPDIRVPLRPGRFKVWRYDGEHAVPAVAAPSPEAVRVLREVADQPWPSPLSGLVRAAPLGELPRDDLLGLLVHTPPAPGGDRWEFLGQDSATYWYRFLQPWVCFGLLHRGDREVLLDLAFGVEDWVCDAALFALVTSAYRTPAEREEVRRLVRERLDAARGAARLVTIEESLAELMLITPGCTSDDRTAANATLNRPDPQRPGKRRWWRRKR